jgi:hypothetical protein
MKVMKTATVAMVFAITMLIGSVEFRAPITMSLTQLSLADLPVSFTLNEAQADSGRRVARRTARRTSKRN